MKPRYYQIAWAILLCLPLHVFGQKTGLSNVFLQKKYEFYKNADPSLNHLNYFDVMSEKMHLGAKSKMVLEKEIAGKNGFVHYKFQQMHDGAPVFGAHYILHEQHGQVVTASGYYRPQLSTDAKPHINAATALAFAQKAMKAWKYEKKSADPVLCFIDPSFPKVSENEILAYQVDVESIEPFDKRRFFVDAYTGKILANFPLILREGVPSTAKTRYYGVQNIITDSIAPQEFVLHDPTRGGGIYVYNQDGTTFTSNSSNWDLTNPAKDEVALDAHYCTQEFYDMMLEDYQWQGQDGQGLPLVANVHVGGPGFVNAFWDGQTTSFGDGDCNYGPLTTLEVVGHEFTHGVVEYTSQLVYNAESGAMNESLADMFGKLLERRTDPGNFSWVLSHSFLLNADAVPFRIMDNPNLLQMPAYYKGLFWDDFSDVHTNSSIGNLWFSMLVDGKQGTNEVGYNFNVPALGPDKTGQIVFETNKGYLTENSNYAAFYNYSIQVAEDLYGVGSTEANAVKEAWKAVGVDGQGGGGGGTGYDLTVSGDMSFDQMYCSLNQLLPVTVRVANLGSVPYNPSASGKVILNTSFQTDYILNLTSPIAPGEVFETQVTNWLLPNNIGLIFVNFSLDLQDDNPNNNFSTGFYNISEFENNDLVIFSSSYNSDCFALTKPVAIYIQNASCNAVPSGTEVHITVKNDAGNTVLSTLYTLQQNLEPGGSEYATYDLPTTGSPFTFILGYPSDPNPGNNVFIESSSQTYLTITGNYLNNFEVNMGFDEYLNIQSNALDPTMFYQNSNFFGATGFSTNPEDFQHCSDPLTVFDSDFSYGLNGAIRACVDFSFSPAPRLEFDLAQFTNQYADTSNFKYSSMLQAKWKGNENGSEVIYGQPEGQVKHHTLALPPNFKGELALIFYTELGSGELNPSGLSTNDFELLDNLKLTAPTSGTQSPTAYTWSISPNPAHENVNIQAQDGIKTIILQNVSGQTLRSIQVNTAAYTLDLNDLQSGFYFLSVELSDGKWATTKLAKI